MNVAASEVELRAPLRRPAFRRLALSFVVNEVGDWLGIVALTVLVFDRTDSALATMGLFLGSSFLPALVAPALVARVEKTPPRVALGAIYTLEALAFAGLALLADNFLLAAVIAIAAADGVLLLVGRSLTRAVAATMLEPAGELRSGNAILNVGFTAGAALGPLLGGLVVAGLDVQSALLLNALSFIVIAGVMLAGPLPYAAPEEGSWTDRLRAGIQYISARAPLLRLLLAQGAVIVFFYAIHPIEVIYAKDTLGSGDAGYGSLLASWGIGMVLGGLVFARLRRTGLPLLLLYSTVAVGVAYLGMAAAPTLLAACAISVVGGAGNGIQWVAVVSAIQEMTRISMQARVVSVLESLAAAMPGLGYVIGGLVGAGQGPRVTFVVAGTGVLVVVAIAARFLSGTAWTKSSELVAPDQDESSEGGTVDEPGSSLGGTSMAGREGS